MQIPANRMKPNKFVLNAVDQLFKAEKELLDIDARVVLIEIMELQLFEVSLYKIITQLYSLYYYRCSSS
jgi:hypothetical protein